MITKETIRAHAENHMENQDASLTPPLSKVLSTGNNSRALHTVPVPFILVTGF